MENSWMYYLALFLLAALIIGVWLSDKREARNAPGRPAPIIQSNLADYERDPGYKYSGRQLEFLNEACAIANQHASGRWEWVNAEVYVNLGWERAKDDFETLNNIQWLEEYSEYYGSKRGERNGVIVHIMDGDRELTGYEREKAINHEKWARA